ncbi:2,3-diketo-5-methylthio-1-phosphopentane phosphatase [Aulographum hederae CBS 113979]|uniref:2,3-diketo-5-methylthio-1-phosphopentane phosphatase n=1 Tax=Aulographum hederae CBS 113979 TaxID=1176131 RepID=A0A6G1HA50_9PEZI|nr:2,3-diketo-5-methylthio-1-phosphopentane phosphatase [Aulographum hederae CBS 113979]
MAAAPAPARPGLKRADTSHMGTKRKIICFSDFDGTIFMQDTGHILFNRYGCGSERREELDTAINTGTRSFKDVSEEMWGSLNVPFEDGFELLKEQLEIDVAFKDFHEFCRNNDIPFNVISAGLKPVLRKVLDHFIGEEQSKGIEIVANEAEISKAAEVEQGKEEEQSTWKVVWKHQDSELGHDKSRSIQEYKNQAALDAANNGEKSVPLIVFIGDGVSDLPAAKHADVLFARRGLRLEEYCIENQIPYFPYDTFADIQSEIIKIAHIDQQETKGEGLPKQFNPRANLWRRASSRKDVREVLERIGLTPTPGKERGGFLWEGVGRPMETVGEERSVVVPAA